MKLDAQTTSISFHGRGGLTITKAFQKLTFISQLEPYIIFIQLGENNMDKIGSWPIKIVDDLRKLMGAIFKKAPKTRHIFWGEVLHSPALGICPKDYSAKIHALNTIIKTRGTVNFHYWPHKGLWQDSERLFCSDGVHFNHGALQAS